MLEQLIAYFTKRHLVTNLIFISVLAGGIFSWNQIKKEEMPDVTFDRARISAVYPGATAEEAEHFATKPVEDEVKGFGGVSHYKLCRTRSTSITVELEQDCPNKDEALQKSAMLSWA